MKEVKQFQLLISAPSDVSEEVETIKRVINTFNFSIGKANNITVLPTNWKDHSFPESGGQPQELLNKQLVDDSDGVVAVFWTRFGSPTLKYDSGTEEEIEIIMKKGKQVFLYFSDKEVSLSSIDVNQYSKIQKFKEKYANQGIYQQYKDIHEFEKKFLNHLTLYFLSMAKESTVNKKKESNLIIKSYYEKKIEDKLIFYRNNYSKVDIFNKQLNSIKDLIKKNNNIKILPINKDEVDKTKDNKSSINYELNLLGKYNLDIESIMNIKKDININTQEIELVEKFIGENNLIIENDWYEIGNLYQINSRVSNNIELIGKKEEKEKYENIYSLIEKIKIYNGFKSFFEKIDNSYTVELIIENNGQTFDEDIVISLYLPKNKLIMKDIFSKVEIDIIEEVKNILSYILRMEKTHNINSYDYDDLYNRVLDFPYIYKSIENKLKEYKAEYEKSFIYDVFEDGDYEILKFNLKYLKHNEKSFIPTRLFFNEKIDLIKYEITSKLCSKKIEGEIKLKKES